MSSYIFDCYPGSKAGWDETTDADCLIEPFVGGGRFMFDMLQRYPDRIKHVFIADADITVSTAYRVWLQPGLHPFVYDHMHWIATWFKPVVESWAIAQLAIGKIAGWAGKWVFLRSLCQVFRSALTRSLNGSQWQALKHEFEHPDLAVPERVAAVSIWVRKLLFGGVVRDCQTPGSDEINVSPSIDKLSAILNWQWSFPPVPKAKVFVGDSWEEAIAAYKASSAKRAIALVDPPYWVPFDRETDQKLSTKRRAKGLLTPCYRGHQPHVPETMLLSVDPVRELLADPRTIRVIVTNYYSHTLGEAIARLRCLTSLPFSFELQERLDGLNRSGAKTTDNRQAVWAFGVCQNPVQLNLLEAMK